MDHRPALCKIFRPPRQLGRPDGCGRGMVAHRGALAEVRDGGGTFKVLNLPFRMSGAKVSAAPRMATLGEHTRAYLKETGLSDDEIAAFAEEPAVAARR